MSPSPISKTEYLDRSRLERGRTELLPCDFCPAQAFNLCKPLERNRLKQLLARGRRQRWRKGEFLFHSGERTRVLHKISQGMVAASLLLPDGRRQVLAFNTIGDLCGTLETNGRHVSTAQAITDLETCSFARDDLDKFLVRHDDVMEEWDQALRQRLNAVTGHTTVLGRLLATEKLAHFLIELAAVYAQRGIETKPMHLPMTRADIADYLGLTVETVSRTFGELRKQHLIRTFEHGAQVLILDWRRLGRVANAGLQTA